MEYFAYIVLSLVILLLMVLIHEAGHYTMAKILGFTVDEFSIGFGPKIFQKRRKNGELFSLRMLPLGGYCAFLGEEDETEAERAAREKKNKTAVADADSSAIVADTASVTDKTPDAEQEPSESDDLLSYVMRAKVDEEKPTEPDAPAKPVRLDKNGAPAKTFNEQKPWKRLIVLIGGVLFNFLSAFVFSLIYIGAVGFPVPVVEKVYSDAAGELYCPDLRKGDVILAVDGEYISVIKTFAELTAKVKDGETVEFTVERDGERVKVEAKRDTITVTEDGETNTYSGFGISTSGKHIGNTAANAFKYCVPYTFKLSWSIIGSFVDMFTGQVPITSISGPVGSINLMAKLSVADWRNILILLPLLASNLAIFNILPFPALDGSKMIFTVIEWIRGKPINRKVEGMIHFVGMVALLLFVVIVDILSFAL